MISTVEQKDIKKVLRSRIGCYFEILLFIDSHRGHFVIAKGQTHHLKESERVSRSGDEDMIDAPGPKQFIGQFICTVSKLRNSSLENNKNEKNTVLVRFCLHARMFKISKEFLIFKLPLE